VMSVELGLCSMIIFLGFRRLELTEVV